MQLHPRAPVLWHVLGYTSMHFGQGAQLHQSNTPLEQLTRMAGGASWHPRDQSHHVYVQLCAFCLCIIIHLHCHLSIHKCIDVSYGCAGSKSRISQCRLRELDSGAEGQGGGGGASAALPALPHIHSRSHERGTSCLKRCACLALVIADKVVSSTVDVEYYRPAYISKSFLAFSQS